MLVTRDEFERLKDYTVERFLRVHPNTTLDLMTPGGYVYITPEIGRALLEGGAVLAHAGWEETLYHMKAEEILGQVVMAEYDDSEQPEKVFSLTLTLSELKVEEEQSSLTMGEMAAM